jgi:hypothetical protein
LCITVFSSRKRSIIVAVAERKVFMTYESVARKLGVPLSVLCQLACELDGDREPAHARWVVDTVNRGDCPRILEPLCNLVQSGKSREDILRMIEKK